MEVTGIILAGGKSSRMGQDKGLMTFNGIPMILNIINTLKKLKIPTIIISNQDGYDVFELPVYPDIIKDKGPMGGIHAALSKSSSSKNLIISCDTPLITPNILEKLIDNCDKTDVTLAQYGEQLHPLIAVYDKSLVSHFEKKLHNNQLKLRRSFTGLNIRKIDFKNDNISPEVFNNLNTKEEFNKSNL